MPWNDLGSAIVGAEAYAEKEAMRPGNIAGRSDLGSAFAARPLSNAELDAREAARVKRLEAEELAAYEAEDAETEPLEPDDAETEELALATARAETARTRKR